MPDLGKLLVFDKGQLLNEYTITKPEFSLGREPVNDMVISHPEVSRRHARLFQQGQSWRLENLSQSNPVRVNGMPVSGPVLINPGDRFTLGNLVVQLAPVTNNGVQPPAYSPPPQPQPPPPQQVPWNNQATNMTYNPQNPGPNQPYPHPQPLPPLPNFQNMGGPQPVAYQASGPYGPVQPGPQVPPNQFQLTGEFVPASLNDSGKLEPAQEDHFGTIFMGRIAPVLKVHYENVTREYTLTQDRLTIGRANENDIVVPISTVSRLHAILTRTPTGYTITDQNSTNGLLYKGAKVREIPLTDGDLVRIGDELGNVATLTYTDLAHPAAAQVQSLELNPNLQFVTIGRLPDNALVLNYPQVSGHHAAIQRQAQGAVIRDLGSINGTFIRGQRIPPNNPVPIQPGDIIQIAGYQLVYQENQIAQAADDKVRIDAIGIRKAVNNNTLVLLNDISLSIQPKEFVAIVGGSGAGKSTLMDALNGFRPSPEGRVLINGDDYYQNFGVYRSSLGYVPQDDIIHRDLTVERALYYVAKLRLPKDTTDAEIEQRVSEVLEDVEMTQRRTLVVSRLSGGQRKRVSIAVELLAKPNLFFLDEPTSGLDPGLDKRMMFLLRRLADQGRTIILVTHATSNITACDKVVFMAPGGKLCFFGPPREALKFFEVNEFADIYSKLEQTPTSGSEWEGRFRQSPYYKEYVADRLATIPPPLHGNAQGKTPGYGAADSAITPNVRTVSRVKGPKTSNWRQFAILTRRYAELVRRDRINLLVLILQAPIIGIILALVADGNVFANGIPPADAQKVLFMLGVAAVWLGTSNAAREITKENPIYLRERLVNLRVFPYVMSKVAVLTLLCIVQSVLLAGIVLLRTGAPPSGALLPSAIELIIGVWLTTMAGLAMGLLVSSLASNTDKATSIVPIILVPQIILAGLIFPLNGPGKVLSYVTVTKWSIDSLGTTADLNRQYYQVISGAPPGVEPSSLPIVKDFDPENYDNNPNDRTDFSPNSFHASRAAHLAVRWLILVGMIVLFLGLTCYFTRRKDRAWERR